MTGKLEMRENGSPYDVINYNKCFANSDILTSSLGCPELNVANFLMIPCHVPISKVNKVSENSALI